MKKLLGLVMVLVCGVVNADDHTFVMTPEHCALFKEGAVKAITSKTASVTFAQFTRERVAEYNLLPERTSEERRFKRVSLDILPYILATAEDYTAADLDLKLPYEKIVYERCMEEVNNPAQ